METDLEFRHKYRVSMSECGPGDFNAFNYSTPSFLRTYDIMGKWDSYGENVPHGSRIFATTKKLNNKHMHFIRKCGYVIEELKPEEASTC